MRRFSKNSIVYGTILLSFSGLLCRGIGFLYRLFISHTFGEESMGIFQLTSPILMLAFSLTCAGIQTAVSRYTASCIGLQNQALCRRFLLCGCSLSLFLSILYSILVYFQAENISIYILQEAQCIPLLRICAFCFPFSALHSCFNGYFYGIKNTKLPALTQLTEQLFRVGSVFFLYAFFTLRHQTPTIALTCIGMFAGEASSFLICFFYFLYEQKKEHLLSKPSFAAASVPPSDTYRFFDVTGQLAKTAFPLTLNRVIVNLLQSYETVSIPIQLKKFGYSSEIALSIYGVLTGMALSLVLFPSTFTNSASVLLLPTVSEAASKNNTASLKKTLKTTLRLSLLLGFGCTFFFFLTADLCGKLLFDSTLAGTFIRQLSFLCPFLYLHTTFNSILNGLGKTKRTLFINIFSLMIRLFFILYTIPLYGISGYLYGLLVSEILSSILCVLSLKKYF